MACARSLVTGGPYGVVRHPLYAAEAVTAAAVIIQLVVVAPIVGMLHFAFQFRRMINEEKVLRTSLGI